LQAGDESEDTGYEEGKVVPADRIINSSGFKVGQELCPRGRESVEPRGDYLRKSPKHKSNKATVQQRRSQGATPSHDPTRSAAAHHQPDLNSTREPLPVTCCCTLYLQKGEHYHIDDGYDAMNNIYACGLLEDINIEPEQDPQVCVCGGGGPGGLQMVPR
jgi:hypothetical protein